jgi:hypothetical protein
MSLSDEYVHQSESRLSFQERTEELKLTRVLVTEETFLMFFLLPGEEYSG